MAVRALTGTCRRCGRRLVQRDDEPPAAFRTRQSCGQNQCQGRPRPLRFPGASLPTYQDAPASCDRCGGPWRWVPTGLVCYLCPRELIIAGALQAALRSE